MRVNSEETTMDSASRVLHQGLPFTGEVVDTDGQGLTLGITGYQDGLEHGPQFEWYADGAKRLEGQSDRGSAVGEWRQWHANGRLAEYTLFNKYGELIHLQRWDEDGTLLEEKKSAITRGL
ncbi:hypothetical protein AB0K14_31805 [Actinosynnema sp. NPDC050801]|uniref:toxin-antitoxin system YwqK family antitoxin n=1 Tax=unclassified Actinosynnema TaxID=2637065 RepID=UPI0033CFFE5A